MKGRCCKWELMWPSARTRWLCLTNWGGAGEILQPAAGKRGYVEAALPNYFRRRPTVDFGLAVTSLIQACWLIRSRG